MSQQLWELSSVSMMPYTETCHVQQQWLQQVQEDQKVCSCNVSVNVDVIIGCQAMNDWVSLQNRWLCLNLNFAYG
jgi:hypothetical protein